MADIKDQFLLHPEVTYLNHGSFGACPKPVFEKYQHWQLQLERESVQFITKRGVEALKASKNALAAFINADADDFVFVPNPTTAINIIAKNIKLQPGDEILSTNNEYGALDRTWNYYCKKAGAKYVQQPIPLPLLSKEEVIEHFWKGYTPQTKVIYISQITSPTALIFPVKEICERAKELNLLTIVDGAHVPGHIPLDLSKIKADIYTGALHKWLLLPKGNSFLYVKKEFQNWLDPIVISWGYEAEHPSHSQFLDYHEYQGTRDIAAFLCVPEALQFFKDFDWVNKTNQCKQMIKQVYPELCDLLGTSPICTDNFLGQMCSIPIRTSDSIALKETLYNDYRIEIPVTNKQNDYFIRLSLQPYNTIDDVEILKQALIKIKAETSLLS